MTTTVRSQRDNDALAAHRVYKKVVTPGLNSVKYVDRSGFIVQTPRPGSVPDTRIAGGSASASGYLRRLGHGYKEDNLAHGHHKVTTSRDHKETMHRAIASSSTKNIKRQKQSNSSTSPRKVSSISDGHDKSRTSTSNSLEHYLRSIVPENYAKQEEDSNGTWNQSQQGLRLEKEKTALDNCRSMRRTSEIVQHRIDKMYFMNGSAMKLQPKYKFDNEELLHLKVSARSPKETKPPPERAPVTNTSCQQREIPSKAVSPVNECHLKSVKQEDQDYRSFSPESGFQDDEECVQNSYDVDKAVSKVEIRTQTPPEMEDEVGVSPWDILSHGLDQEKNEGVLKLMRNITSSKTVLNKEPPFSEHGCNIPPAVRQNKRRWIQKCKAEKPTVHYDIKGPMLQTDLRAKLKTHNKKSVDKVKRVLSDRTLSKSTKEQLKKKFPVRNSSKKLFNWATVPIERPPKNPLPPYLAVNGMHLSLLQRKSKHSA